MGMLFVPIWSVALSVAKSSIGMVQKELNEKYKVAGCEVINYEVKTMKKRLYELG